MLKKIVVGTVILIVLLALVGWLILGPLVVVPLAILITAPSSLFLTKEEPRHYLLSADIYSNGNNYQVNHSWSCKQKRQFSANTGWGMAWHIERKLIAKNIHNDLAIYFYQPRYCRDVGSENHTLKLLIATGEQPKTVITFNQGWNESLKSKFNFDLRSSQIIKTEVLLDKGLMSIGEKSQSAWMANNIKNYRNRLITVVPKDAWKSNDALAEVFSSLDKLVTANDYHQTKNTGSEKARFATTFLGGRNYSKYDHQSNQIKFYSQVINDKTIVLDENNPVMDRDRTRNEFSYDPGDSWMYVNEFCYWGKCKEVRYWGNELYHAPTEEMIIVSALGFRLDY
ncbi:MAG: hypothetical protein KBT55_04930 [Porticoccus sp.]|nr:hypothetical protein [Porticoccus sp.]